MKSSLVFLTSIVILSILLLVHVRGSVVVSPEKWTELLRKVKNPRNYISEKTSKSGNPSDGEKSKTFSKILHDFLLPVAQKSKSEVVKTIKYTDDNGDLISSPDGQQNSGQTSASDRIFYPPYKFPFWGLPYGLYSNGGFFNPGLFPFVPGGVAFPPYDGIFGGPFMDTNRDEIVPDVPPTPTPSPPEEAPTESPSNPNNSYNGSSYPNYPMPNYYSRVDQNINLPQFPHPPPLLPPLPLSPAPLPYNNFPVPSPEMSPMMPDFGQGFGYGYPFPMPYPNPNSGFFPPYSSFNYNYNQEANSQVESEEDKEATFRKMRRERLKKLRIKKLLRLKKLLKKQKEEERAELPCCCDNEDEEDEEDNCNPDCECPSN